MVDFLVWFSFLLTGCVAGWFINEAVRSVKDQPAVAEVFKKWRILEIHYKDANRTKEWYRYLQYTEYNDWNEAMKRAKKLTDEDTLRNDFRTEYEVVEAP